MWVFITGLWANPLVKKIIIYVGIAIIVLWAFKIWLNRHDDKVYQEGKTGALIELEKAKKDEWAAKEKELAKAQKDIELTRGQINLQMTALEKTRQLTHDELTRVIASLKAGKEADSAKAHAVPADRLDDAIRALSAELAATKAPNN